MKRLVVIGLVALGGCQKIGADDRICTTPPPLDVTEFVGDKAKPVAQLASECVHRWGYRLAGAADDAPVVADAVMAACAEIIDRDIRAFTAGRLNNLGEADKRRLYEETSAEDERFLLPRHRAQALFHVVQARAGKCAVPG